MSNGDDAAQEFIGGEITEVVEKIRDHSPSKCTECPTREGVLLVFKLMQKGVIRTQRMNWIPLATAIIIALVEAFR